MIELAQNLILNEDVLNSLPENKRFVFIYEWLCFLNKVLIAAQKNDIQEYQSHIIEQLLKQIHHESNPAIRILIGRNLATIFSRDNSLPLFINTINRCNEILETNNEIAQLTTVVIIGVLYERLGRFVDQSYEETVQLLLKILKNGDSQMRIEVLHTLERIINGLGSIGRTIHREIFTTTKTHMCDRVMSVRSAAAMCLIALINQNNFMYTSELEGNIALGFRAFDGSNYEVRCSISKYLAKLLAASQDISSDKNQNSMKKIKIEDLLNYLAEGFLHGHINSLKSNTNEQLKVTTIQHEIRIGVTYTYIELIRILGTTWIEQNLSLFINHILELAGNPCSSTSHIDAIFSRKCITFILRSFNTSYHNEKVQFIIAKELITIIIRYIIPQPIVNSSSILINDSNISSLNSSTNSMIQSYGSSVANQFESTNIEYHQHILICVLHELSLLIQNFGSSTFFLLQDNSHNLIETLFLVILNPSHSVRLSGAWCFRSIALVLPSLITPLIDKCLEKMNELVKQTTSYNVDAIAGFSLVLQALLGVVHQSPLGIPSQRVKTIFNFADNLLYTSISSTIGQQQSLILHMILQRTHTSWNLLSSCCTLDQQFLKKILHRLLRLWNNVFPRSRQDFDQEKQRGDLFTWILSFNQRSGALCSMISFLNTYSIDKNNLLTDDLLKHILNPIIILFHIPNLIKQFGHSLKVSTTIFRLRLYELLLLIPIQFYEQHFKILLTELIAEFTLIDSSLNTITSLIRSVCNDNNNNIILGNWSEETDYQIIEEQLQINSVANFRAFEHDETYLYRRDRSLTSSLQTDNNNIPSPLTLGIAVIDTSIQLYSNIFIRISNKHRLNMIQHFIELIKQSKDKRQEALQINIITVILLSLKNLFKIKSSLPIDDDHLKKSICTLIIQMIDHSNPVLRYTASEALGRLIKVIDDGRFINDITQICFNHLKESRNIQSRTGYSLAIGFLYRFMNKINKRQYLNLFVPILLTLIQDQSATIVQISSFHALISIVDSSGEMFYDYVESLLSLILHLLLSIPSTQIDIYQCCGRLLRTLIINMGPELQTNTDWISTLRSSCLTASNLLQMHSEPIVQAEAIQILQQLHVFIPRHVNLSILVPDLIKGLKNRELSLRRACISCLRQLAQREAKEITEYTKILLSHDTIQDLSLESSIFRSLEEILFSLLDTETDSKICSYTRDTLIHILQALGPYNSTHWLHLCKEILNNTTASSFQTDDQRIIVPKISTSPNNDDDDDEDYTDNQEQITSEYNLIYRSILSTKWETKFFTIDCIQKLINYCEQIPESNLHFNYISAKEHLRINPNEDYLVTHLNILLKISFMACTSTSDQLRLSGLSLLKQIIQKFAHIEEDMNLPGHVILEQYQAQIGATIRPAFSPNISSHVTAQACDVCSTWISSNVAHDINDLRRAHQLLVSSLQKFTSIQQQYKNDATMIYNETTLTIENLSILKLWADVYNFACQEQNLLMLIQTELYILIHHWLAVLTDYAFLILPKEFGGVNRNFHSIESDIDSMKIIYRTTWPVIIQAATHWLTKHDYELEVLPANHKLMSYRQGNALMTKLLTSTLSNKIRTFPEKKEDIFSMLFSSCVEALSISILEQTDETIEIILLSLTNLLQSDLAKNYMTMEISIELIKVLHRLYFNHTNTKIHLKILEIVQKTFHFIPDETVLFNSLELLAAILFDYHSNIIDDTKDFLISLTVQLLYELIKLSTINESKLTPVILHLMLSTSFALLSTKSDQHQSLLVTIFQLIENIFNSYVNETISQRAMVTIMNLRTNLIEKNMSDNGYFIRCLTSLITNSNSIRLTKEIIDFYQKAFEDQEFENHLCLIKCLTQLFQSQNHSLRNKFIQIFTPLLLTELKQTNNPQQIIEILKTFEILLSIVDPTMRIRLASLIIPLIINFLPDPISSNMHLRSYIIERIQYLLPIYPNEFRLIFQTFPDLRTKLENSIHQKEVKQSIIDFSNFKIN